MAKWWAAGQDSHVKIGNKKKNKKTKKTKEKEITNRGNLDIQTFICLWVEELLSVPEDIHKSLF